MLKVGHWKLAYRWLVIMLGIGFLVLIGGVQGSESLLLVALYSALAAGMEATRIQLECGSLSLSSSLVLTALVTLGVPAALIVGAAAYLLGDMLRQRFTHATVFNAAQAVLAILVASYPYHALGGTVGGFSLAFLLPQTIFLAAYYVVNHALVGIALFMEHEMISWTQYKVLAGWDLLATLLSLPVGVFFAQVYEYLGRGALSLAAVPVLTLSYVWHLYAQIRYAHTEIMKLYEATRKIGTSIDLNTTLDLILEQAKRLAPYDEGLVYLIDGQTLMPVAHKGPVPDTVRYGEVALGQGFVGTAALRRVTEMLSSDNEDEVVGSKCVPGKHKLALPLTSGEQLVGVLVLRRQSSPFKDREVQCLSIVAVQAATALENARLYSEVAALARLDGLTGLLNRRALLENLTGEIARCCRYELMLSILMVDLDNFKKVNDVYGHMAGDALLTKITASIKAHVRSVDVVGRYGGDEIVIVLPETGAAEAYEVGERICNAVRNLTAAEVLPVTTSIGIAGYPQDGTTAEELLTAADQAMYRAKRLGGNRVLSFAQLTPSKIQEGSGSGGGK